MLSPMSRASVYRDLAELGIKPLGVRQRPQRWPDDAADKIRSRRGIVINATAPTDTAAAALTKLPTLAQLRKARTAAKGKARR